MTTTMIKMREYLFREEEEEEEEVWVVAEGRSGQMR
jgi:hypothetical protein